MLRSIRAGLLLALGALLMPEVACAQDDPPDTATDSTPPTEGDGTSERPPPDGAATGDEPDDPAVVEARNRFRQGVALARAGNCAGALAEFNASLALVPRANTLYNIAQCQEDLHRYDLAVDAYDRYLSVAPADDPDRAAVEATVRTLRGLLGTITITSSVEAEVWLDDRVVGRAPGDVLVPGGRHVIELRAQGYVPEQREVEVAARSNVTLDVTLRELEENITIHSTHIERPPVPSGVFYGGVALTLVSLGVGAYFGVTALSLSDQARGRPDPRLPPDTGAVEESALLADVFFLIGGVIGITTAVLAFMTDFGGEPEPPEDPEAASMRLSPVGIEGSF